MALLLNINNTFTKLASNDRQGRVGRMRRIPTAGLTKAYLAALRARTPNTRAVVACVVPAKLRIVEQVFSTRLLVVSPKLNLGRLVLDYPGAQALGTDRIANLVAAAHDYEGSRIVLDCGTAVTLNLLTRDHRFIGGMIAPGLQLFSDYLKERTALLPSARLGPVTRVIGRNTGESVDAGVNAGYEGMLAHLIREAAREAGFRKPKLIVTGGDGKLFASRLPLFHALDEILPMRGLALLDRFNS